MVLSLFVCGVANAGPLGKVVDGMREAARDDDRDDDDDDDDHDHHHGPSYEVEGGGGVAVIGDGLAPTIPMNLDALFGAAVMQGSGPALSGVLRLRFGGFAVAGGITSFFENDGGATTRLDLWRVGGALRLIADDRTELWLDAALAGVYTQPELSMMGVSVGGRLEHRISRSVGLTATGGIVALEHDVDALELGVSARLFFLTVGYRVVDFNVGPPLHGPEVGLSFSI